MKIRKGQKVKLKNEKQVGRVISGPPVLIGKKDNMSIFPITLNDKVIIHWDNGLITIEKLSNITIIKRRKIR